MPSINSPKGALIQRGRGNGPMTPRQPDPIAIKVPSPTGIWKIRGNEFFNPLESPRGFSLFGGKKPYVYFHELAEILLHV